MEDKFRSYITMHTYRPGYYFSVQNNEVEYGYGRSKFFWGAILKIKWRTFVLKRSKRLQESRSKKTIKYNTKHFEEK